MRKKLLAVAALSAAYVLPAEAAMFKVDENTFANFGVRMQVRGQYLGKINANDKADLQFGIPNSQVYFAGQVNKLVYFGASFESANAGAVNPVDMHIGLRLGDLLGAKDAMNLQAGLSRVPVTRTYLTTGYALLVPTGHHYHTRLAAPNLHALRGTGANEAPENLRGNRHGGIVLWGNIAGGMIKYYLGMFDVNDKGNVVGEKDPLYAVRVQFTPTMLGFKGEKGYTMADTYLGKQNVLSIGIGYASQKVQGASTASEFTVDALWEQKFGDIVPNLMLAYKQRNNQDGNPVNDGKGYIVQGQLLYDQTVGIGKPALAVRYSKSDPKAAWSGKDVDTFGAYINYYIKGQDAKISLGADSVRTKNRAPGEKNYTDLTLQLQTMF